MSLALGSERVPAAAWGRCFVVLILLIWAAALVVGFIPALSALTLLGFGAAIVGIRERIVGLFGISILCTLDAVSRIFLLTGGLLRWNTFNYWLLLYMFVFLPILLLLKDAHSRFLQLFVAILAVEILFSPSTEPGILQLIAVAPTFGLIIYCARAGRAKEIWLWVGLVNGVLGAGGGLIFYLQQSQLPYANPNALVFFWLSALFTLCLGMSSLGDQRRGQLLLTSLAVVSCFWIFLSGSRGGLLTGTVCLLFMLIETRGAWPRLRLVTMAVLLGVGVAAQFSNLQASSVHRLDALFDSHRSLDDRTSGRSDLVLGGWHIFLEHPFGVGTGGFANAYSHLGSIRGSSGFGYGEEKAAHAGWIKILTENGIPGVLILAAYLGSFAVVGALKRQPATLRLGMLITLGFGLTLISCEFQAKGLWFFAAAATVILKPRPSLEY